MIPHSTGAAKSIFRVMPELSGKVWGTSVRVPCINCSLLDINVTCEDKTANLEAVKDLLNKVRSCTNNIWSGEFLTQ